MKLSFSKINKKLKNENLYQTRNLTEQDFLKFEIWLQELCNTMQKNNKTANLPVKSCTGTKVAHKDDS